MVDFMKVYTLKYLNVNPDTHGGAVLFDLFADAPRAVAAVTAGTWWQRNTNTNTFSHDRTGLWYALFSISEG